MGKGLYARNLPSSLSEATPPAAYRPDQEEAQWGCAAAKGGFLHLPGRAIRWEAGKQLNCCSLPSKSQCSQCQCLPLECDRSLGTKYFQSRAAIEWDASHASQCDALCLGESSLRAFGALKRRAGLVGLIALLMNWPGSFDCLNV